MKEPETFSCFKEKECQGIEPYQIKKTLQIGVVPKVLNGEGVCYIFRLTEGNYRQVENIFFCGPKPKRPYFDITLYNVFYNKLSQCYLRYLLYLLLEGCGNSCFHYSNLCRDSKIYEFLH